MYSGLTTRLKWLGELSESFPVLQGVRQGEILSTYLYKIFVEDLLLELENAAIGFHLGNIYVGTPTCADDIAFTKTNKYNLQVMLNFIHRYVNQHHYNIHPTKTKMVQRTNSKTSTHEDSWNLGETLLQPSDEAVYLGIKSTSKTECEINILPDSRLQEGQNILSWGLVYMAQTDWIRKHPIKYIIHMFCQDYYMD